MDAQSLRADKRTSSLEVRQSAQPAAQSGWLIKCQVTVKTGDGAQHSYGGLFTSTCDAVMDAFDHFGIAKIGVEAIKQ